MRILAAFDSFKESMSAYRAGEAVKAACASHNIKVHIKPMADGGEGTMSAINSSLSGTIHELSVTGPRFNSVEAQLSIADSLAIIECAQACGLEYLSDEEKDARVTTSIGVGEMIRYAVNCGADKVVITLGGSATNDGGIGMLSALGVSFYDENGESLVPVGESLGKIATIDLGSFKQNYGSIHFKGICDVDNPLTGKQGATYTFGPQKGLKHEDLICLDAGMRHYAKISAAVNGRDDSKKRGAGAAGGLGFAILNYLGGELVDGIDEVIKLTHLEEAMAACDVVFTGEGKMDLQTLHGKTPYGVLRLAQKYHKKVIAFAGKVEHKEDLLKAGFADVRCINHEAKPLDQLLKEGPKALETEVKRYLEEHHV